MDLDLEGKVAFVAGSSRGIGFAVAQALLREGARVVLSGRDETRLASAVELLTLDAKSDRVHAVVGDMTDPTEIRVALERAVAAFGGLDVVVANVGTGKTRGGWDLGLEDWQTVLKQNLLGSTLLASASLPHLLARRGNLVFVSSIAGWETINAPVSYAAAKAAVISAMKSLSRLAGPQGVRVNAIAPGNVLFPGGSWEQKLRERRDHWEKFVALEVPLQRFGRPEEIADAVVFLASSRAAFITGACLVVDGGQTRAAM